PASARPDRADSGTAARHLLAAGRCGGAQLMTTSIERPPAPPSPEPATQVRRKGNIVVRWMTSTDHKVIGYLYLSTSFFFFLLAGLMAVVIRMQLWQPGQDVVSEHMY